MTNSDIIDFGIIDNHPGEAVRFFKIMMRMEYALKACEYVVQRGARLEIQWDAYANKKLGSVFFKRIRESGLAKTLIGNPPSRQILSANGKLGFNAVPPVTSVQDLLGAVCRVRNNLFHGGKSADPDHTRNDALISEAICVIEEILKSDQDLRFDFEGKY